jgi:uncharacterized protein YidB (DUF937 family)
MGLMDELAGQFMGGSAANSPAGAILEMLSKQPDGLGGLEQHFQQGGLGNIVASWIGTGANLPISPDQVQSVLGNGTVAQIATRLGVSPEVAAGQLAQWLPTIVDTLTPGGSRPQGDLMSVGMTLLRGFLNR